MSQNGNYRGTHLKSKAMKWLLGVSAIPATNYILTVTVACAAAIIVHYCY